MKSTQQHKLRQPLRSQAIPARRSGAFAYLAFALGLLLLMAISHSAHAFEKNPQVLLESVSNEMITALNEHREQIKQNPQITQDLIEKILMPHLDFITAAKYVLGKHWDTATKEQKIAFIKGFRTLLVRFYSSALTEYLNSHNDKLDPDIMVYHAPADMNQSQLMVRSEVRPQTGKPVPVNYQMRMTRKGWKIFDVSVEGVSVITTYKTSFASEIQQNGLDALISSLESRNNKLRTTATSS